MARQFKNCRSDKLGDKGQLTVLMWFFQWVSHISAYLLQPDKNPIAHNPFDFHETPIYHIKKLNNPFKKRQSGKKKSVSFFKKKKKSS